MLHIIDNTPKCTGVMQMAFPFMNPRRLSYFTWRSVRGWPL